MEWAKDGKARAVVRIAEAYLGKGGGKVTRKADAKHGSGMGSVSS